MAAGGDVLLRFRRLVLISIILILSASSLVVAQEGASLHGTVIVPSGAPVAQVTITVEGTGGGQAATTNGSGHYTINGLNPGTYSVKVTAPGYELFEVTVSLVDSGSQEIDAVLTALPPEPAQAEPAAAPQRGNETQPASAVTAATHATAGQRGDGELSGIVTDQSGAVIPVPA